MSAGESPERDGKGIGEKGGEKKHTNQRQFLLINNFTLEYS